MADVLQQVADGGLSRVMIFMPPRHGKSEETSRLFSAYYLWRHPERWVGINSYAANLAYTLSRAARENFQAGGGALKREASAVNHWETPESGGMWAAGVGGPITGKGFHLGIIDDPLKNAEDAASETIREKQKEWYSSTFYTREEPGGAIVVIQTRWNEDDLSGWLLTQESEESPERWHIVSFPAIAEEPGEFPPSCTTEQDWRKPGEALCPPRYTAEKLLKIAARIGEYFFGALFQQRPSPREGTFFQPGNIAIVDAPQRDVPRRVRVWDLAATEGGGDWTVGTLMSRDYAGALTVEDVVRGQWSPDQTDRQILQTARLDGDAVAVRLAIDPGAAGKRDARAIIKMLAGYDVRAERVTGPKATRARPFAAQVNAGNVRFVKAPWNRAMLDELRVFPNGSNDDFVDTCSDALSDLAEAVPLTYSDDAHARFWDRTNDDDRPIYTL